MKTNSFTLLALLLMSAGAFAQSADEAAIKATIEGESAAFHQREPDKVMFYWLNAPYVSHYYNEKGTGYVRGYEAINNGMRMVLSRNPEVDKAVYKNHDYLIRINGSSAWATFITDRAERAKTTQTYDARYLEKADGVWKLVAVLSSPAL